MSATPPPTLQDRLPLPSVFRPKPVGSWVAIGVMVLVFVVCWAAFFGFIQQSFEGHAAPRIEADSTTYFQIAGVLPSNSLANSPLVSFGGNLLGPVLIAKVLRYPFFVVLLNFAFLAFMVHIAGSIPGVRRRYFLVLFFLNAESFVAIVTLNKEILGSVGLVAFAAAVTRPTHRKRLLFIAMMFSLGARWEQVAILLLYLLLESRFSPFRQRHKFGLFFILGTLTIAYTLILRYSGIDLNGFLAVAESSGLVARLDNIQAHFGLPLVIVPKMLMNLFNRILLPSFFISPDFLGSDFSDLQNNVIIHLHTLAMLMLTIAAFVKRRLGVSRPIPYLLYLYLMITCVSPFVQPRYEFPLYALLCLLCSFDPTLFGKQRTLVEKHRSHVIVPAT